MTRNAILIVDSNQLFREELKQRLKARFVVSGEGSNLIEAIKRADPGKPADLVMLTLASGSNMNAGLVQIGLARRDYPSIKLVALAASLSSAEFMQAMRAGVDAILTNDVSSGVLQASLELVLQSQKMFLAPMGYLLAEPNAEAAAAGEPKSGRRSADKISNLVSLTSLRSIGGVASAPPSARRRLPGAVRSMPTRPMLAEPSNASALVEREILH